SDQGLSPYGAPLPPPSYPPPPPGPPPGYPAPVPGYAPPSPPGYPQADPHAGYGGVPPYGYAAPAYGGVIVTKAGPAPGLVYAGFWIRFLAWVFDAILVNIVAYAIARGIATTDPVTGARTISTGALALLDLIGPAYL